MYGIYRSGWSHDSRSGTVIYRLKLLHSAGFPVSAKYIYVNLILSLIKKLLGSRIWANWHEALFHSNILKSITVSLPHPIQMNRLNMYQPHHYN